MDLEEQEERINQTVERFRKRLTNCGGQNTKLIVRDREYNIIDAVQDAGLRQNIFDAWSNPVLVEDAVVLDDNEKTFIWVSLTDTGLINDTVFPEASENNKFRSVHRSYRSRAVMSEIFEAIAETTTEIENIGYL